MCCRFIRFKDHHDLSLVDWTGKWTEEEWKRRRIVWWAINKSKVANKTTFRQQFPFVTLTWQAHLLSFVVEHNLGQSAVGASSCTIRGIESNTRNDERIVPGSCHGTKTKRWMTRRMLRPETFFVIRQNFRPPLKQCRRRKAMMSWRVC